MDRTARRTQTPTRRSATGAARLVSRCSAAVLALLITLPFTAPFSTCELAVLIDATFAARPHLAAPVAAAAVGIVHVSLVADDATPALVLEDDTHAALVTVAPPAAAPMTVRAARVAAPASAPQRTHAVPLPLRL